MKQFVLIDFLGGKKMTLTLMVQATITYFAVTQMITVEQWINYTMINVGGYGAFNVTADFAKKRKQV